MKRLWMTLTLICAVSALFAGSALAGTETFRPDDLPVLYIEIDGGQPEIDREREPRPLRPLHG